MGALAVPVALCVSVGTLHALPKKPHICPTRASGALSNDSGGFLGSGETLRRSREVQGRLRNSGIAPEFLIEWLLIEWNGFLSNGFLGSGETLRRSREVQGRLRNSGIAPAFLIEWLLIEWPLPIPP